MGDPKADAGGPAARGGATGGGAAKAAVAAAVLLGLGLASVFLPVKQWLAAFLAWTEGLGPGGPVALAAMYVVACVLLLPGSILTLGAGAAFGFLPGLAAVSVGSTLGACAAFWVGRTFGRGWIEGKVRGDPRLSAVDAAVGREGWKIVFLTRLSPVFPFNILNFFYGVTQVRFFDYATASWIGMLPGTAVYVLIGATGRGLAGAATGQQGSGLKTGLTVVGLVATVAVTAYVTKIARRALDEAIEGAGAPAPDGAAPGGDTPEEKEA